jgi:putative component of toxin-antitoxin plasmid stabilization module
MGEKTMTDIAKLTEYRDWLRDLKQQIKKRQIKASLFRE